MPLSTTQLLRRAEHAGAQIAKLCQLIYQRQAETGIHRILGVLSLIKEYGAAAVEDACATALDIGVYEYRFVRRYLERRPHPQTFLRQIDPHGGNPTSIRQARIEDRFGLRNIVTQAASDVLHCYHQRFFSDRETVMSRE